MNFFFSLVCKSLFFSINLYMLIFLLHGIFSIASSWKSNCIPGDIYIDSTALASIPSGSTSKCCTDWCDDQCSILGLPHVEVCRCCCGSSPPSPCSPPSGPLPPPAPQSPSEFEGRCHK
ncbi:hypothetical protein MKX03_018000, partial [Papaver bracteatum]